jgi:HEAT repeat protein
MATNEEIKAAKEIVQALLKARKTIRMYPDNNPVYKKTLDECHARFLDFFAYADSLDLKIKQTDLLWGSEQIYHSAEKEDNFALFFFKDGLRELSFRKELSVQELQEFLKLIALDFDRDAVDDDVVTLLWERDFQGIKYVADEAFLLEDDSYETEAVESVKKNAPENDELQKAYLDAFNAEDVKEISIVNLADKDLQSLVGEIEKDSEKKIGKLTEILFEMLLQAESTAEREDIYHFLSDIVDYCLAQADLKAALDVIRKSQDVAGNPESQEESKRLSRRLINSLSASPSIAKIGELLDSTDVLDEELLNEYVSFLDRGAIAPFIALLGEMKSIHGRKHAISILVNLGKKDLGALAKGLHDPRWYVVRNIIYILRQIGDKKAVEHLLTTSRHSDVRVRKESVKALGELKSPLALQALRDALDDPDSTIRRVAAKSLGSLGSETAKRILVGKVSEKGFLTRDFDEKLEFFEALSVWNDAEHAALMLKIVTKKSFFKRARIDEKRACAAHCLGLMGNRDALPVLSKLMDSGNKVLREYAGAAMKRIEHGR